MGRVSYGEKKVGNKEKVDGETDGEEELVRDGKEFWVGPIDVSGQQEQPAPGNCRYKKSTSGSHFFKGWLKHHHVCIPSTPVVAWPKLITSWKEAA